jgi:release factor glutamine methyltransferase
MTTGAGARSWTLLQMIQWSSDYLSEKGFENGRLLSERLLCHVLGLRRVDLYLQFDRPLTADELAQYKKLFVRLIAHEPLQYLLGESEFMSLSFRVGPGALIPRPETELLVEKALVRAKEILQQQAQIRIVDLGTGSGCIAITLAHEVPEARVTALDASPEALQWAALNCEEHGVNDRVTLVEHDFMQPLPNEWRGLYDLVVSNPPYIRSADWQVLAPEIRDHEPCEALIGGEDGLEAYRHLAEGLLFLLRRNGEAFVEIGHGMGESVGKIFAAVGLQGIELFDDLAGKERLVHLFSPGGTHE